MRSRKTAAVTIALSLTLLSLSTTAKSATLENVLTTIHSKFQPESVSELATEKQDEIICLALNQYHEARGSTEADIMAVGFSTRNRVAKSGAKSYCSTVWEKGQYEWAKRPLNGLLPKETSSWLRMVEIARRIVTNDDLEDTTHGADSFFVKRLHPFWARRSPIHMIIGAHCFVKLRKDA